MPDQIEVVKPDNDIIALFMKEPLRSVTKAEQVQDLLGQDVVNLSVVTVEPLDLTIGHKVTVFGKTYFMNQMPTAQKKGERHFEYELTFEGPQYSLRKARYFNADVTGFNTTSDFSLTGNCELFLDVLLNNLARVFGAGVWLKGDFPTTAVKTISFNENNCLAALQTICKEFETEFDLVQGSGTTTIHIRKVGQILGHTYQYGRGYGLYELKRQTVDEADIITRLYPFGSGKNLRSNYRNFSQRLRIDDPGYIDAPDAIAAFGLIEGEKTWDDIYPHRIGTVTSVTSLTSFVDASMDFDLFEESGGDTTYLTNGNTAKIHFNTGNLAGYEFEVLKYDHSTKTFTITPQRDERGLDLPHPEHLAFQIQPGDEYVILDINLPDTYVETAEAELLFKAQQFLDQNKAPKVQYSLTVDEMYLSNLSDGGSIVNYYEIGDYVHILDDALAIDKSSRIISLRRDILHPYRYQLTLDDTYQVSIIQQLIKAQKDVQKIIKINDLRDPNRARMGWKTTLELLNMIFDTDGYFDGGKIKPESIETMMLVVGAKSQQFILQDVVFQPNFEGNANVVEVSEGLLIHYALKEEILTWNIEASTHTIPDNNARYIYAKVHKTDYNEGHIIFSTAQILPDEDPTYYHFLVGTLHSVMEGVRWISLTYGATAINGRFIKTGRIQSFDGLTFFDLDLGAIGGYIKFIDSQGNYRDLSDIGAQTDRFFELTITEPLDSYPAGYVTAWFQVLNPATWPSGEEAFHEGDHWYNPDTDTLFKREGGSWVPISDAATVAIYRKQYGIRGNNTKVRLFTAQPVAPYSDNDLWMSENGLRRSVKNKTTGQPFDPNNWVEPFNFDNTATAIDGHIVTSGIIQLAGDKNAIWAGVSGQGTDPESVRFWAGASTENRDTAPFRVFQNGWLFARNRIEVEGVDASSPTGYKGQAGLAGSETEERTGVRIYAGSDYEGKETAPFRVTGEGHVTATKGRIGGLTISGQSLTNVSETGEFNTDAMIVFRDDPNSRFLGLGTNVAPGSSGLTALIRANNNEVDPTPGHRKFSAIFSASGGTHESAMNYAIYTDQGISMLNEALLNGRRSLILNLNSSDAGETVPLDPTLFDIIGVNYPNSGSFGISMMTTGFQGGKLKDGKEITIISLNDVNNNFYIMNTLRGNPSVKRNGGSVIQIVYLAGFWYYVGDHDNNW